MALDIEKRGKTGSPYAPIAIPSATIDQLVQKKNKIDVFERMQEKQRKEDEERRKRKERELIKLQEDGDGRGG